MRFVLLMLACCLALSACEEHQERVGGGWVKGHYSTLVNLDPVGVERLELDIYEDFTCPACQRFEQEVLPVLQQRYGNKLILRRHFLAAPSTQVSPMVLYAVGERSGKEAAVASALMRIGLEHKNSATNDVRVRHVAKELGLAAEFEQGMKDDALVAQIRAGWAKKAHMITWFPQVVIQGELVTDGDQGNLISILDSLIAGGNG
jgi:protein-disulfide isomerase